MEKIKKINLNNFSLCFLLFKFQPKKLTEQKKTFPQIRFWLFIECDGFWEFSYVNFHQKNLWQWKNWTLGTRNKKVLQKSKDHPDYDEANIPKMV